jgi:hypothetical protein
LSNIVIGSNSVELADQLRSRLAAYPTAPKKFSRVVLGDTDVTLGEAERDQYADVFIYLDGNDSVSGEDAYFQWGIPLGLTSRLQTKMLYIYIYVGPSPDLLDGRGHSEGTGGGYFRAYSCKSLDELDPRNLIREIEAFRGRQLFGKELAEIRRERRESIEQNATTFISTALKDLAIQETKHRIAANNWYKGASVLFIIGLVAGLIGYFTNTSVKADTPTPILVFGFSLQFLRTLFILGLLVAAIKYCIDMGKANVGEAIRLAHRQHAIRFGQFFLNVYGDDATWEQIKEAFAHWNLDTTSTFSGLNSNDYDPRFIEAVVTVAKSIGEKGEKK